MDLGEVRQIGAGIALHLVVALELRLPAGHLTLEVALGLPEAVEILRRRIDRMQRQQGIDEREAHRTTYRRIRRVECREPRGRLEAVDRLHQVERGAENVDVALCGDQPRMRHVGVGEGAEHASLAAHRLVGILAFVLRRPTEDERAPVANEAQQQVLRATRERFDRFQRARTETLPIHPVGEEIDVDDRRIDRLPVSHHRPSRSWRRRVG